MPPAVSPAADFNFDSPTTTNTFTPGPSLSRPTSSSRPSKPRLIKLRRYTHTHHNNNNNNNNNINTINFNNIINNGAAEAERAAGDGGLKKGIFGNVGVGENNCNLGKGKGKDGELGESLSGFRFRVQEANGAAAGGVEKKGVFGNVGESRSVFVFGAPSGNEVKGNGVEESILGNVGGGFGGKDTGLRKGEKEGFVFGVSSSSKVDVGTGGGGGLGVPKVGDHVGESCSNGNVEFRFGNGGGNRAEFEILDELKKLNIENLEKGGSCSVKVGAASSESEVPVFVFGSGGRSSGEVFGEKVSGNGFCGNGNGNGVYGSKPSENGNMFVFGSCSKGGGDDDDDSSFGSQASPSGIEGEGVSVNGEAHLFSFVSRVGAQKAEATPDFGDGRRSSSWPSFSDASTTSSADFSFHQFDGPLLFAADLPSGLGGKVGSSRRTRVSRGRNSKRTKGKFGGTRKSELPSEEKLLSGMGNTEDQEINECYSPMDFSPYEDTSLNNDLPPNGDLATDQTNLKTADSSAVHSESQPNQGFANGGIGVAPAAYGTGVKLCSSDQNGKEPQFGNSLNDASSVELKFAVNTSGSTSTKDQVTSVKRHKERKYKLKKASLPSNMSAKRVPSLGKVQDHGNVSFTSERIAKNATEVDEKECDSVLSAAEKACDKWRKRGNEAYERGKLSKAEDFYTWGINSIPLEVASTGDFTPLVCCYSNRAATRMALGRVREAIQDCLSAVKLDLTFYRAQIRAANCHLLLGELESAMQCFGKIVESNNVLCLDRQVIISASDGMQKVQKVMECTNRSAELLNLKTSEAAATALELIAEAMEISSYSEKLLQMKAEALCMLHKHEEAIALCQQTLGFAEKNFSTTPGHHEMDSPYYDVRLWRDRISSKCQFHLGRLELALDLLEKHEDKTVDSADSLAVTIRALLKQKTAGNAAFQAGRHAEAVDCYTDAISSSMESRSFAAILFCNRAAANQALGQIVDAIADCSLAIALDENYAKAVSRRATLHEMIRDYKQAAVDLQRLVYHLEKQSREKSKQSGSGNGKELRQVQQRLSLMEEEAKGETPLDFYLILGIKKSDSAAEIKKAYRRAALKHHPDKAAQLLVKSDGGDEGRLWKDIAELIYKDSDRLFKMIGEAYAVLSDPTKREEYDHEEGLRKVLKECSNFRSTSRRQSNNHSHGSSYERSSNRRSWQDSYRSYGSSYGNWP